MIVTLLAAVACAAIGAALGFVLRASTSREHDQLRRNAAQFMREGNELRHTVMDFVRRARLERPPDSVDWRALVEAMMHRGTPQTIRELHHEKCGTAGPTAEGSEVATEEDGS